MTNLQMKKALNAELRSNDLGEHIITTVAEVGENTALVFKGCLTMRLLKYLNDRFANGITIEDTCHPIVYINTPNQTKVII